MMNAHHPPGPPRRSWSRPWEIVSDVRGIVNDAITFVGERFETYGDTYHVDEGAGRHLYVTRDPAIAHTVLVERGADYQKRGGTLDRLVPVLGEGLLTADGDTWREARRTIQPAFRTAAVRAYAAGMTEMAQALSFTPGTHDLAPIFMRLTLAIAAKSLFDHAFEGDGDIVGKTMQALNRATDPSLIPAAIPTLARRRRRLAIEAMDALMAELITTRRRETPRGDVLSALIAAELTDTQIRDQLVTLFLAGHETGANALSWTLWLLAQHPEVEARLHAEVDALPGDPDASSVLPWMDAVFAESMRLYPPAYAIPRVAAVDTVLGDHPITAGSQVLIWTWHLHRHPAAFANPDLFQPERFFGVRPPAAWMPFGAGQRKCIGSGFALLQGRLILATLARRWRFSEARPVKHSLGVNLAPAGGMPLRVERRGTDEPS